MKHKVFIIVDNLGPGGTQRQIIEYLKHADRVRFDIKVVNLNKDYQTLADEIEGLGYEIIGIRHSGFLNFNTLFTLTKLFKKEKPAIVHTYLFTSDLYGRLAAKLAGVPVIISSVRNVDLWQKWHHIAADRILARFTDRITVNAEAIRPYLTEKKRISPAKIATIYNGIDLRRFEDLRNPLEVRKELGIPADALVAGMVSRFSEQKDYETFFAAAAKVIAKMPNVYFVAVGDGALLKTFRDEIASPPSGARNDRIVFTGLRKDIPDLINAMDVCVLASHYEGCPNVILEYMACSKPTIASDVGGCAELIIDDKTGFIVPPKDPQALADKIMTLLLKDVGLRQSMGKEGRKRVEEHFTSKVMASKTEALYDKLLQPRIAFVLSQFPETHETFILREFKALEEKGFNFRIFSLKPCRDRIVHHDAWALMKETIYGKVLSPQSIVHGLRHPVRTISSFLYVVKTYIRSPRELARGLYVWMECLYLAPMFKREKIGHIHSHWATMPTTAAVILSKLTGIPFSFTAHAWDIFVSQRGLAEKIRKAKFVVTCTEYNKKYLEGLLRRSAPRNDMATKIYLNYHGLEKEWFEEIASLPSGARNDSAIDIARNDGKTKILAIGRLVEQKGFGDLIEACAILKNKGIDFGCNIVGEGPLRNSLQSMVDGRQLEGYVKLLGMKTQEEIKQLYREADIFTAPSVVAKDGDRDGIPNVVLEAMAIGLPVVTTDVSGLPEVVINEKTGLVVPARSPESLAMAMEIFIKDDSLRNRLGRQGKEHVQTLFDLDKNINGLIDIFRGNVLEKKVKILYLIWSLGLGGAERVVINLAKGLDRAKFNPIVCCLNTKGQFACELENAGIAVIALHKRGPFDIGVIGKLVSVIKKHEIDIMNTHLFGANFWGRIAANIAAIPVIATEHNVDVWKTKFHFALDRLLARKTNKIIAVSNTVKEFYADRGIRPDKIRVIYNGIEVSGFSEDRETDEESRKAKCEFGINDNEVVFAVIGRLVEQKGHKYLFEALSKIRPEYRIRLLVIGDGPLLGMLRSIGDSPQLKGKIIFTGVRNDVTKLLRAVDVLVLPSLREGMPMVILEAMSVGIPVIATRVGGTPEVVSDGETGILVPPADAEALREAIVRLVADKELARIMGKNGHKNAKEYFSLENMVHSTEEAYQQVVGGR